MVRQLKHPPAKVWHALTDPSQLSEWAPFDPDRSLAATGVVAFSMAGGSEPSDPMECIVTRAEPPNVLEYHWGGDVVRWELRPIENGTRLTLHHTVQDRTWAPKVAAGWHICLDVMERAIDGRAIGRIVAAEAKAFGWERLNADYAEKFGVENTGWPEQVPAG